MRIDSLHAVGLMSLVLLTFVIGQLLPYENYRSAFFLIRIAIKI
jgi:hypothetical protein